MLWQLVGARPHTTRRVYLAVQRDGAPSFLAHQIDAPLLAGLGHPIEAYLTWQQHAAGVAKLVHGMRRIAMEYSPGCVLPVVARVDAGTVELFRSLGVEVVSSSDLIQHTVANWGAADLASHQRAVSALEKSFASSCDYVRRSVGLGISEIDVASQLRADFEGRGFETEHGPIVAANEHSGDPHFEPSASSRQQLKKGDWLLFDFWAREQTDDSMYADMTWVAYLGDDVPSPLARAFEAVCSARDRAIDFMVTSWARGVPLQGWQVDEAAREVLRLAGYGEFFTHRLGHSLGRQVHASGVNLDGFETRDTRLLESGACVTVEPGVYLPEFGVRSEVNVVITGDGPIVTTPIQREIIRLLG